MVAFAVGVTLLGLGSAVFAATYTGQRIGGLAVRVQYLEAGASSATLTHVYIAHALTLAEESPQSPTIDAALEAADLSLQRLDASVAGFQELTPDGDPELTEALVGFSDEAAAVTELMRSNDLSDASTRFADGFETSYQRLSDELGARQREDAAEVNVTTRTLGNLTTAVRFLVIFAIPALAMTAYRWVMQRQRRRAELELRLVAEQRINRAKDEFIANVSHELRTPLTGIVGFAQLLQESPLAPHDYEIVRMIIGESIELSRMVDDLLAAAKVDAEALSIGLAEVDILQQVEEVATFMGVMGARLAVDCKPATVKADPERLRQMLRNLAVNAHRYGGPNLRVVGTVRDDRYLCSVVDDGPGIAPEVEERLFSRFVHRGNTPLLKGSIGLGLAIVNELAHRMGCEVIYRRIRNETWFTISIPLVTDQRADGELVSSQRTPP